MSVQQRRRELPLADCVERRGLEQRMRAQDFRILHFPFGPIVASTITVPSTALNSWVVSDVWCSGAMSAGASSGAVWLMMLFG
jgi:hypothetical protein